MKSIKYVLTLALTVFILQGCNKDKTFFGDTIFNFTTIWPYVSIQDRNEVYDYNSSGNNFWGFEITAENSGNQIRIEYRSQDPNIISHQILVGFDDNESPPADGVVIATITAFPTELIFSKQDIATALNVPIESLATGSVYFGGISTDADGHVLSDPNLLEDFLIQERHAYFYEWILDQ